MVVWRDFLSGQKTPAKKIESFTPKNAGAAFFTDCMCRLRRHDGKCEEIRIWNVRENLRISDE